MVWQVRHLHIGFTIWVQSLNKVRWAREADECWDGLWLLLVSYGNCIPAHTIKSKSFFFLKKGGWFVVFLLSCRGADWGEGSMVKNTCSCKKIWVQFSAHPRWLTTICNFNSRGSDPFVWSPWAPPGMHVVHTHTCRQNTHKHINLKQNKTIGSITNTLPNRTKNIRYGGQSGWNIVLKHQ